MRQPSLIELGFDIEKLRVIAFETVRTLADHFEPAHTHGLRLLLDAGEFVQRNVIGPTTADSRPYWPASRHPCPKAASPSTASPTSPN